MKLPRRRVTPTELAASELADAEVALLSAHTGQEFAASIISYNKTRIARLREFLAQEANKEVWMMETKNAVIESATITSADIACIFPIHLGITCY